MIREPGNMSPGSKNSSFIEEQRRLSARRPNLRLRARIIQAIRRFFIQHGYLEIETPHLIPAPAPEAHISAISAGDAFLHTSPELCMKRLLSAGYRKIFQICRCFRHGEKGELHWSDFSPLDCYRPAIISRDQRLAERFELYMGGVELANAFSELTDAREQERRFEREREKQQQLGKRVYPIPDNFLKALPHMPRSAGIALGVDRFIMVLVNKTRIDDVVSFTPEEL